MEIYFGFTVAGESFRHRHRPQSRRATGGVRSRGADSASGERQSLGPERLISPQDVYRRDMAWLEQCDLFIAEVSGSSFGLGYEAGFLLGSSARRAVLFYRRDATDRISLLITGNTHPNCTLAPYSAFEEIETVLQRVGTA